MRNSILGYARIGYTASRRIKIIRSVEQELEDFRAYALARLAANQTQLTIEELFDEWKFKNRSSDQLAADEHAIAASLRDFDGGERGIPAGEVVTRLRSRAERE